MMLAFLVSCSRSRNSFNSPASARRPPTLSHQVNGASELIRDKYFEGEGILFKDAIEDLEQQTKIVQTNDARL